MLWWQTNCRQLQFFDDERGVAHSEGDDAYRLEDPGANEGEDVRWIASERRLDCDPSEDHSRDDDHHRYQCCT